VKLRLLYGVLILCFLSCSKGGAPPGDEPHVIDVTDDTFPSVQITTPTDSQVFTSGSTINVTGLVTDNSLYRGFISITNESNGLVVKDQAYEIHYVQSYNYSISHLITVTTPTEFTVKVSFEDHGPNMTTKTVKFKVNP
jgi:hypothetical protein